jgi:hypothetical protein
MPFALFATTWHEATTGVRWYHKSLHLEWSAFIAAVDATHGRTVASVAYRLFVFLHFEAVTMAGMK